MSKNSARISELENRIGHLEMVIRNLQLTIEIMQQTQWRQIPNYPLGPAPWQQPIVSYETTDTLGKI